MSISIPPWPDETDFLSVKLKEGLKWHYRILAELSEATINTLSAANEDLRKASREDLEAQRAEKAAEKKKAEKAAGKKEAEKDHLYTIR